MSDTGPMVLWYLYSRSQSLYFKKIMYSSHTILGPDKRKREHVVKI